MKTVLFLILILFFSFVQTTIWEFNFLLLLTLFAGFIFSEKLAFLFAFLSGFFLDLLGGSFWGLSSLAFLIIIFLLIFSLQRFSFQNPWFLFLFGFFSSFLFSILVREPIDFSQGLILAVLLVIFGLFLPFLTRAKELKLEV